MEDVKAVIRRSLSQPTGILPAMLRRNAGLEERLVSFLSGERRLLVIGGEPANGKSLLATDLVLRHRVLAPLIAGLPASMAVVSWDRIHEMFFECLRGKVGQGIPLPKGETLPEARMLISEVMRDVVLFSLLHLPPTQPILVETPLIDRRGELLVNQLPLHGWQVQVLAMHSPECWRRVVADGIRISEASGQVEAMRRIRNYRLQEIVPDPSALAEETQDQLLEYGWRQWLQGRDGMVVSWAPADDEAGYQATREAFRAQKAVPDTISPLSLSQYARRVMDSVLETLPDLAGFAERVRGFSGGGN